MYKTIEFDSKHPIIRSQEEYKYNKMKIRDIING